MSSIKTIGTSGQIALGKEYAGRNVLVEEIEPGVWVVKLGDFIPDNERWLHTARVSEELDEAVAWACTYAGKRCVTAKVEARFREPARVGMPLVITGRVTRKSALALRAHAEIRLGEDTGALVAELDAMMAVTRQGRQESQS